jgi:hypothetical protein
MSLGEDHIAFIKWSKAQGVKINGIAPANIPDRRLGMVATRKIKARSPSETLLVKLLTV